MVEKDTNPKRDSILEAAAKVFIDEGYDNASMDRIADRACASKRTVYNHFPSKEILFQAVIKKLKQEISSLKQIRYDGSKSLESQLAIYADGHISIGKNPSWLGLSRMMMAVLLRDPELVEEALASGQKSHDTLEKWIQDAADDGKLEIENAKIATKVFRAMMIGAFYWPMIFERSANVDNLELFRDEIIFTFLSKYGKS